MKPTKSAGRPRTPEHLKRVSFTTTMPPNTKEQIYREADRLEMSCGDVLVLVMKAHMGARME